jgi:hypothetical protein
MTHQALLDHLDSADADLLRHVLEHAMHRLIEAEAVANIGAGPHSSGSAVPKQPRQTTPSAKGVILGR